MNRVGEDVQKWDPLYAVGGLWTGAATVENSMDVSQKAKTRTNIWPSNFTPGYIPATPPKKTKKLIWRPTCTRMFITALFTSAEIWMQPKYPSTNE